MATGDFSPGQVAGHFYFSSPGQAAGREMGFLVC